MPDLIKATHAQDTLRPYFEEKWGTKTPIHKRNKKVTVGLGAYVKMVISPVASTRIDACTDEYIGQWTVNLIVTRDSGSDIIDKYVGDIVDIMENNDCIGGDGVVEGIRLLAPAQPIDIGDVGKTGYQISISLRYVFDRPIKCS